MVNYQLGKIYRIRCNITGDDYVGSTCEPILARRLAGHVSDYKLYLKGNRAYVTSFDVLQNGDYDIILIENYPCNSKDELYARERYWANQIDCVNKIKGQGLICELGVQEYKKQYRHGNKEHFKEYEKQRYERNKDQLKQYYQDNKDQIKQYYQVNKDKLQEKHTCECGGCYRLDNRSKHMKTLNHQEYIANKKWYDIKRGLQMIKALDKHFN